MRTSARLDAVAGMLGAERADLVARSGLEALALQYGEAGLEACSAQLPDGRLIALGLRSSLTES